MPPIAVDIDLAPRLRLALTRLGRRLRQQSDGDVTATMLSALSSVDRLGPLTLGELAVAERVQPPTITRVAGRLVLLRDRARTTTRPGRARSRITKAMPPRSPITARNGPRAITRVTDVFGSSWDREAAPSHRGSAEPVPDEPIQPARPGSRPEAAPRSALSRNRR